MAELSVKRPIVNIVVKFSRCLSELFLYVWQYQYRQSANLSFSQYIQSKDTNKNLLQQKPTLQGQRTEKWNNKELLY